MSKLKSLAKYLNCKISGYFQKSSIQGLRYITEPNRNITERMFWTTICLLSYYGTYKLFTGAWYNFQNNSISFVVDTNYLKWNTSFAAISICELESTDSAYEAGNRLYGGDRPKDIDAFIKDIAYFDGICLSCTKYCGATINCTNDFNFIIKHVRSPCRQLMKHCNWRSKPFDCCSEFLPLDTEVGKCYTINSKHTKKAGQKLNLMSNRQTGSGIIDFQLFESAKVYLHAPEDVPYLNHPINERLLVKSFTKQVSSFMVTEIVNDPELKHVPLEKRNCRFTWENNLKFYRHYSYSTCVVDCRARAQLDLCNCTSHFLPRVDGVRVCDVEGLACLSEYAAALTTLKTRDSQKEGLVCDCGSNCEEPEYTIVGSSTSTFDEDMDEELEKFPSQVFLKLQELPKLRFKRNVVRTGLDLVVSMGGTAGLFLGASLLSITEFLVFMFLRDNGPSARSLEEGLLLQHQIRDKRTRIRRLVPTRTLYPVQLTLENGIYDRIIFRSKYLPFVN